MIAFRDPRFDGQLLRALGHGVYGGAALGECLAAAATISNADRDSWQRGWTQLADRTFEAAAASWRGGHRVSALNAFLRASNYYRSAYVLHLQSPLPPSVPQAYRCQRDAFARAAALMPLPPEPLAIAFGQAHMPGWFCPAGPGRRLALARDCRVSSEMLHSAISRGLVDGGAHVVDAGVGPTPMLYFAVHHTDVDGGIMITGSHNPAEENGFKMMRGRASFFGKVPGESMSSATLVSSATKPTGGFGVTRL